MKRKVKSTELSLTCKANWLDFECHLPLRPLKRGLTLITLAAATVWGGPELLRFVQMLLGQG